MLECWIPVTASRSSDSLHSPCCNDIPSPHSFHTDLFLSTLSFSFFIANPVSLLHFPGASSCPSGHCLWCFLHLCWHRVEGVRCLARPVLEVLQHSYNPHLQTETPTGCLTIQLLLHKHRQIVNEIRCFYQNSFIFMRKQSRIIFKWLANITSVPL